MSRIVKRTEIRKAVASLLVIAVVIGSPLAKGNDSLNSPLANLAEGLNSPEWFNKMGAATRYTAESGDKERAIELFANALKLEIETPSSLEMTTGAYVNMSDQLKRQFIFALVRTGKGMIPYLRNIADTTGEPLRDWLIISLGYLQDSSAQSELRKLFKIIPSSDEKALAVRALFGYKNKTDTVLYKQLLTDPYKVTMHLDTFVPGRSLTEDVYPVRQEAASGLRQFGYAVTPDSTGEFKIIRNK